MQDGAYYMGVSHTTGTDFYLFIEPVVVDGQHAQVERFDPQFELIEQLRQNKEMFRGRHFSTQQMEVELITGYGDSAIERGHTLLTDSLRSQELNAIPSTDGNAADDGIRVLTSVEWKQAYDVLKANTELYQAMLQLCSKQRDIRTGSLIGNRLPGLFDITDGHTGYFRNSLARASLVLGYSDRHPV